MFKNIPPITKNLLIINLIIFMAQLVGEQRGFDLTRYFGLHFILADHFMPHQLVSYLFLHASFSHLFFNMFSLWMFGCIIERTMGFRRFLTYYFVCGIGAGLCQELWQYGEYLINDYGHYDLFNIGGTVIPASEFFNLWNTVGASGACYGVLLAFGMTFPNERIMLLIPPIPMKAKYFVVACCSFSTGGGATGAARHSTVGKTGGHGSSAASWSASRMQCGAFSPDAPK